LWLERGQGQRQGRRPRRGLRRRHERPEDQRLLRGQGLPQPSGEWPRYARGTSIQFAVGSARVSEPLEEERLRSNDERRTMYERTRDVTFWGRGFSNTSERISTMGKSRRSVSPRNHSDAIEDCCRAARSVWPPACRLISLQAAERVFGLIRLHFNRLDVGAATQYST